MQKIKNDIFLNTLYKSPLSKVAMAFPILASAPNMNKDTNMATVFIINV